MARNIARSLVSSLIIAAVCGTVVLLLFYVFFLPTSDVRTRIYILIGLFAWRFTVSAFVVFLTIGLCASWLAGWRNRWSAAGAVVGSLVPLALIYSRVMGLTVWMHDEDVTTIGTRVRVVFAIGVSVLTWLPLHAGKADEGAAWERSG